MFDCLFQLTNSVIRCGTKQLSLPEEITTSIKEVLRETVDNFQAETVANVSITVTGHFVTSSCCIQVISYHFGKFVPTFNFNLVISYPVWSFRTHFLFCLQGRFGLILYPVFTVLYPKLFCNHFYTPPQKKWRGIMLYRPNLLSVRLSSLRFRTLT